LPHVFTRAALPLLTMHTRADFYIGRGPAARWLGSLAAGGAPGNMSRGALLSSSAEAFECEITALLRRKGRCAAEGYVWSWPWSSSLNTTYTYAFEKGAVFVASFGEPWQRYIGRPGEFECSPANEDQWVSTGVPYDVPDMLVAAAEKGLDAQLLYEAARENFDVARFGGLASLGFQLYTRVWRFIWSLVTVPGVDDPLLLDSSAVRANLEDIHSLAALASQARFRPLLAGALAGPDSLDRDFAQMLDAFARLPRAAFWPDLTTVIDFPSGVQACPLAAPAHLSEILALAQQTLAFACDVPRATFKEHCSAFAATMPDDITLDVLLRTPEGRASLWADVGDPLQAVRFEF